MSNPAASYLVNNGGNGDGIAHTEIAIKEGMEIGVEEEIAGDRAREGEMKIGVGGGDSDFEEFEAIFQEQAEKRQAEQQQKKEEEEEQARKDASEFIDMGTIRGWNEVGFSAEFENMCACVGVSECVCVCVCVCVCAHVRIHSPAARE